MYLNSLRNISKKIFVNNNSISYSSNNFVKFISPVVTLNLQSTNFTSEYCWNFHSQLDHQNFIPHSASSQYSDNEESPFLTYGIDDEDGEMDEETKKYMELFEKEKELEENSIERAADKYRSQLKSVLDIGGVASMKPAQKLILHWFEPLSEKIAQEQKEYDKRNDQLAPYLSLISADKLAVITLHSVLSRTLQRAGGVSIGSTITEVGQSVQAEIMLRRIQTEKKNLYQFMKKTGKASTVRNITLFTTRALEDAEWSKSLQAKIGAILVKLLLDSATVPQSELELESMSKKFTSNPKGQLEPAFSQDVKWRNSKSYGMIKAHPNVSKLVDLGHILREVALFRQYPMVIPPLPWSGPRTGGYFYTPSVVMRAHSKEQTALLFNADDLSQFFQGLDALSEVPWKINSEVFSVVKEAWESEEKIADLPQRWDFPLPEPPKNEEIEKDPKIFRLYKRQLKKAIQKNYDLNSLRCDTILKLEVAEKFVGQTIYFPHNVDFRGRAYPMPPHLNHMGADLARGLMSYDQARPLGANGLKWLKIHCANLHGKDKATHNERVTYIDKSLEAIFDSADNPLDGGRWWLDTDTPWQCLAACFELTKAIRSPDPEKYFSNLPIHQDGTCNGLQHYAALGKDTHGAQSVNLAPSDKPQDVYAHVAGVVRRLISEDIAKGEECDYFEIAKVLDNKIDRKIIKQTVMTSVYGVTFVGARRQIQNKLEDKPWLPEEMVYKASAYVARHTFEALKEMFGSARGIMEWLKTCAKKIGQSGELTKWETAIGLPIIQHYRKTNSFRVKTVLQSIALVTDLDQPVDINKHRTAFPPNFVHSLDSTHMLLTAIKCREQGILYSSVHDSFWSHACDVDRMAVILREQFVELHSQPILEKLLESFQKNFPECEFPPLPSRGEFDLEVVRNSKYFFH